MSNRRAGIKRKKQRPGVRAQLCNSLSGFLIMGNNCLKQLSFGVRSLFFPVVPVVSKFTA